MIHLLVPGAGCVLHVLHCEMPSVTQTDCQMVHCGHSGQRPLADKVN